MVDNLSTIELSDKVWWAIKSLMSVVGDPLPGQTRLELGEALISLAELKYRAELGEEETKRADAAEAALADKMRIFVRLEWIVDEADRLARERSQPDVSVAAGNGNA